MMRNSGYTRPGALVLCEQAVHLLRRRGAAALAEYYIGSLPFILGLLYFWSDMSRSALAAWYCAPAAAGLALLFIWMKFWQVRFCRRLWCTLQAAAPEAWPLKRCLATAARQAFLHASGVCLLAISSVIVFPLAWVYAFYQNVCVLDDPQNNGLKPLCKAAQRQSRLWPVQNHLLLGIMSLFGLFVFFNLGFAVAYVPYLLKSLLGVETVFTLSGTRILNTTFFAVLCALAYLCVDPIIKSAYVLRCFYGQSRRSGDDLRATLKSFLKAGLAIIILLCWMRPLAAAAQNGTPDLADHREVVADSQGYVHRLDHAIEEVLQQRRFAWRLPREKPEKAEHREGWLMRALNWLNERLADLFKPVKGWLEALLKWLFNLIPKFRPAAPGGSKDWRGLIQLAFYGVGILLGVLLIFWAGRWLVRRRSAKSSAKAVVTALQTVDVADESVVADDLSLDGWLALARDLMVQQDFRRALRAIYLSVLVQLAEHGRVVIARYKSNQDYFRELARRAQAEPELLNAFDWCRQAFERVWYGMHPVAREQVEQFLAYQQRIATLVQQIA